MQISSIMTRDVQLASPSDTIGDIAKRMADSDIGFLPVGEGDKLVGMVTDRDIVVRGVAKGLEASTPVREVMTRDVMYCNEDQEVDEVVMNMGDIQVRRLAVVDRNKRLCGVVSLADTVRQDEKMTGTGLSGVTRPGGSHSQANA